MPNLRKITKVALEWDNLKGVINVKFNEKSAWYRFNGVSKDGKMFVLVDRKGEEFRSNTIYVHA